MTRKTKLEKALANYDSDSIFSDENYKGAQIENERLAPLHAALVCALEALDELRKRHDWSPGLGKCICAQHIEAEEALAKIDEALEGMGGE